MKVSEVLFYMNYSFSIRGDVDYSTDLSIKNLDIQLYDEPGKETAVLTDEAFHAAAIDASIAKEERRLKDLKDLQLLQDLPKYADFIIAIASQLKVLLTNTGCPYVEKYSIIEDKIINAFNSYNS